MFDPILIKNIINDQEKNELINWILNNKSNNFFTKSKHPGTLRYTTRQSDDVPFPDLTYQLRNRISSRLKLLDFLIPPSDMIHEGMIASFGLPGDACQEHIDYIWFEGYMTCHFVMLLQSPECGGNPVINDKEYKLDEKDGIFYPVSELSHGTTLITGNRERLIWIFCFCIKDNFRPVAQLVRAGDS